MFDEFVQHAGDTPRPRVGPQQAMPYYGFEDAGMDSAGMAGRFLPVESVDPVKALETGYVSSLEPSLPTSPIFELGRVQYALPAPLVCLLVSNNIITMVLASNRVVRIVRIDLGNPEVIDEADIPRKPGEVTPYKIFTDPLSRHLVITTHQGENFYLAAGAGWKKAKPLGRLKGTAIESIAWNKAASMAPGAATTTREILIGTRNGMIYEAVLSSSDRFFEREDRYLKPVFTLAERQAITGLRYELFPGERNKAVVIVTTSTRIYEFVGEVGGKRSGEGEDTVGGWFDRLFEPYHDAVPNLKSELPGDVPYSELHFWSPLARDVQQQALVPPRALAWLTGPGIYHGLVTFPPSADIGDSVIDSANLLPYPATEHPPHPASPDGVANHITEIPLSIALTEFHFLLLYRDRIMGICNLDDSVVFEEPLPLGPNERVLSLAVDPIKRTYWLYTDSSIFELVVHDEDRDVWRIYLEKGMHEEALRYTKTPRQRDIVLSSRADDFFAKGRYIQAAQCYAQSVTRSFEEVVLKFVDLDERDALRYYMVARLERLRKSDITQRMMLATWLVEIYLSKINQLEDIASSEAASQDVENLRIEQDMLEEELRHFLLTYKDNLDKKTVLGLISRHGRTDILLHYATVIGDLERVVRHWIQEAEWTKAIDVLNRQSSLALYYKFGPSLMRNAPQETVEAWIKQPRLNPRLLIPSLLQYRRDEDGSPIHQGVRYLQHVVTRQANEDPSIHNYLLALYATLPAESLDAAEGPSGEGPLLRFISTSPTNPVTGQPYYDLDYALRTCASNGKMQACVLIYSKMGLHECAVDLALKQGDVELARISADKVEDDEGVRKKLWLEIAKYVVQSKGDIKTAMRFLETTDLLKVEDILPFFPDFVVIDDFKDEICTALEDYSAHIDSLKEEMDEATRSAESIKEDIRRLSRRFVIVEASEKCEICQVGLLSRQFYAFSCQHAFHADCLITEATQNMSQHLLRRILELQESLSRETTGASTLPPSYASLVPGVSGGSGFGRGAVATVQGLERIRELIIPERLVAAIGAGVGIPSKAMVGGEKAKLEAAGALVRGGGMRDADAGGRKKGCAKEERLEKLKDELDRLVANACPRCEGAVVALGKPFVGEKEDVREWDI